MTTIISNSVIPLYINSKDRTDTSDLTTDFTVSLRKSLRNISSYDITDVVVPTTFTNININNNNLIANITVGTSSTQFIVILDSKTYTNTTLAAELEAELNANATVVIYGMVWTVTYNATTDRFEISVVYPAGATVTWSIEILYTPIVDVIGWGGGGATPTTFTAVLTDSLSLPPSRAPDLSLPKWLTVTSTRLTDSINTSYIKSFTKSFGIDSGNQIITLDTKQNVSNLFVQFLNGTNTEPSTDVGQSVSVSGDGTHIAVGAPRPASGQSLIFSQIIANGSYVQRVPPLIGTPIIDAGKQGQSVAISRDNNTMVMGGYFYNESAGGAWIFVRVGLDWVQQGPVLVGTGTVNVARQGQSVAISDDGNTVAIGGPIDAVTGGLPPAVGATWVFTRTAGVWSQQGAKLVDAAGFNQGTGVSLSGDGNTLAVAGFVTGSHAAWVYLRTAGVWAQQGGVLSGTGAGVAQNAESCALSIDGDTLAVGVPLDDFLVSGPGSVWVWTRTASVWSQQGAKLLGTGTTPDPTNGVQQGWSVSLGGPVGDTLAVGGPFDDANEGAVWVYTRTVGVWSQQGAKLVGTGSIPDAIAGVQQGRSVSLGGASGDTLVVGGPVDDSFKGAVWVYTRTAGVWTQKDSKLTASADVSGGGQDGSSMELSSDQSTMVVGARGILGFIGGAYVYQKSSTDPLTWEQVGDKLSGTGNVGDSEQGEHVAISGDGKTIAIGGTKDNSTTGATWIFVLSGGVWTQQGAKIVGLVFDVSLSDDGNTLAIAIHAGGVVIYVRALGVWSLQDTITPATIRGATLSGDGDTLAICSADNVWIYVRTGVTWALQAGPLTGSDSAGPGVSSSSSVDISNDGNTLAFGKGYEGSTGATWIFIRTGTIWTQEGLMLIGTGAVGNALQGSAVRISPDGNAFVVGGLADNTQTGAAWKFTRTAGVWTQIGGKIVPPDAISGVSIGSQVGWSVEIDSLGCVFIGGDRHAALNGAVWQYIINGEFDVEVTATIPIKGYSLADLANTLTTILQFDNDVTFTAAYDQKSNTMTITAVDTPEIALTFVVDPASTFVSVLAFPSDIYDSTQSTVDVDLSINNNVLKIISTHMSAGGLLYDTNTSGSFRKLFPGYTIDDIDSIDIQLRDERDRVIDLNGSDWIMTILANTFT